MIEVKDLTPSQVKTLNKIWAMDTESEFAEYVAELPQDKRQEVGNLIYMVMLSEIDNIVEAQDFQFIAMTLLAKIGIKCGITKDQ